MTTSNRLIHCTLTGVDDATDLDAIADIFAEFPLAEFAILWSDTRAGAGRYPTKARIAEFARRFAQGRIALHVCGRAVEDLIEGRGEVSQVAKAFPRIQVNSAFTPAHLWHDRLDRFLLSSFPRTIITQHNEANAPLSLAFPDRLRHAILFDASGGRGLSPTVWPESFQLRFCGYAGGLGPGNLQAELPRIARAAGPRQFWIDMESSLRVDDILDMARCRCVLAIAEAWRRQDAEASKT